MKIREAAGEIKSNTNTYVIELQNFENIIYHISEQTGDIHDYEDMVDMAKAFLDRDCLPAVTNIIDTLLHNVTCDYYKYDYYMGALETPMPIYNEKDLYECFPPDEYEY